MCMSYGWQSEKNNNPVPTSQFASSPNPRLAFYTTQKENKWSESCNNSNKVAAEVVNRRGDQQQQNGIHLVRYKTPTFTTNIPPKTTTVITKTRNKIYRQKYSKNSLILSPQTKMMEKNGNHNHPSTKRLKLQATFNIQNCIPSDQIKEALCKHFSAFALQSFILHFFILYLHIYCRNATGQNNTELSLLEESVTHSIVYFNSIPIRLILHCSIFIHLFVLSSFSVFNAHVPKIYDTWRLTQ